MSSKKRKQISNETKLEIIQNKDNLKPGELASTFGLPPSTISTIINISFKTIVGEAGLVDSKIIHN
jgi:hypothetical protein